MDVEIQKSQDNARNEVYELLNNLLIEHVSKFFSNERNCSFIC